MFMALASASPFLKMMSASASPWRPDGVGAAFCFGDQPLLFTFSNVEHALLFDFRLLQHGSNQLILVARDFRFLHLSLLFSFNQLDFHLLGNYLLLLDVLLNFIRLVCLRLLFLDQLGESGFLDFKVALRFCLLGLGKCFCQHALLVSLGPGDG